MNLKSALLVLVLVNAWTFFRFMLDKWRAESDGWRVPESELLGLALIGGTPAAYAARHLFRHKTRKQPFTNQLFSILVLQLFGITALSVYFS